MQILYAEKVETQENCLENLQSVAFSSMWIFSAGSDNAVRIHDQMQVVYTEMTRDEAKSNLAKWNLIDGVQFNHMKNDLMFM